MSTRRIVPHLWFDKEAKEAAEFYVSAFPGSKILSVTELHGTPSGSVDVVAFELAGHEFQAISAGPLFKLNPSVSFFVNFDPARDKNARENLDRLWEKLSSGGKALMPLDKYPFSERYGWVQDRYGVSWQLILTDPKGEERPFLIPSLLFVGEVAGRAQEAIQHYLSVFERSRQGVVARYPQGHEPEKEGTLMFGDFCLEGRWFAAMDSAHPHPFAFNEAVSFIIYCNDQREIDYFTKKLSAAPEAEQCGWIKDKFGVSWQIVPSVMDEMLRTQDAKKLERVTQAFLKMKKFDIAALKRAYEG